MKLLKLLILSIFLTGGLPLSDLASLQAESSEQQKKKRKKKKKSSNKSSSKKKKKKKKKSSSKKKKKRKKKKTSEENDSGESSSKAEAIESTSSSNKSKRSNSAAYADELFTLTGELQSSNKELARATRYFNEQDVKPKGATETHLQKHAQRWQQNGDQYANQIHVLVPCVRKFHAL